MCSSTVLKIKLPKRGFHNDTIEEPIPFLDSPKRGLVLVFVSLLLEF